MNIVPMTGKDLNGVETGIAYGDPGDFKEYHINAGHDGGRGTGLSHSSAGKARPMSGPQMLYGSGGIRTAPVPPDERYGYERAERPHFIEWWAT
ncbi:MAG: hypothetical protein R2861_08380 [Desulfobacterales bacterium]